eukprot:TRINITY_DN2337_c2_g1_i1.p1 TRINITY_DN2337_c2_g1~~TRINITY_DN2337_c2_g1_i1.p1  ORF type:complete len:1243 (+),score=325.55 TRINITY_DN2337_c2_g1_i1:91-3729(+)
MAAALQSEEAVPEYIDPFPTDLPPGCVAQLVVFGVLLGLTVACVLIAKVVRGRVPLTVVLGISVCTGLVVVGTVSWAVSYFRTRGIIQDQAERRLKDVASIVRSTVRSEMTTGLNMIQVLRSGVVNDHFHLSNAYPTAYMDVLGVLAAVPTMSVELLYYGLRGNEDPFGPGGPAITGIKPYRKNPQTGAPPVPNHWVIYTQPEYGAAVPDFVACSARDRGANGTCKHYSCGSSADGDFKCQKTCANRSSAYPERDGSFCTYYPGENRSNALYVAKYNHWAPVPTIEARTDENISRPYDTVKAPQAYNPMVRPWWHKSNTAKWTRPYVFKSSGFVGITASVASYYREYFEGVLAVDFSFHTFQPFLAAELPTPNSMSFVADAKGMLIGTSMTAGALRTDLARPSENEVIVELSEKPPVVGGRNDSFIQSVFEELVSRAGSSEALSSGVYLAHRRDRVYFSSPVSGGIYVSDTGFNTSWILFLTLPVEDVMGAADDAGERSLGATIGTSLGTVLLVILALHVVLIPLRGLEKDMGQVARMELDVSSATLSTVTEVALMQTSFLTMVQQLTEYRSFLPPAILGDDDDKPDAKQCLAIAFTDIRHSTILWDKAPKSMAKALSIHNRIVRQCIRMYDGQEIKTVGDSFMVAFLAADSACLFGMAVQEALLGAEWPEDILALPQAQASDDGAWRGPNIRVGVNYGEVDVRVENNRLDYYGPVVNVAARVEGQCVPGAVCVTPAVLSQVSMGDLNDPIKIPMGTRQLVGVQEGIELAMLLPTALSVRVGHVREALKHEKPKPSKENKANKILRTGSAVGEKSSQSSQHRLRATHRLHNRTMAVAKTTFEVDADSLRTLLETVPELSIGRVETAENHIDAVFTAAHQSSGTVLCVYGNSVVVTWGSAMVGVVASIRHAVRYIGMLDASRAQLAPTHTPVRFCTGLSAGPALKGNVGTREQMFSAGLGPTVALVDRLANACELLDVNALFTGFDETRNSVLRYPALRRVMKDTEDMIFECLDGSFLKVRVYQVISKGRLGTSGSVGDGAQVDLLTRSETGGRSEAADPSAGGAMLKKSVLPVARPGFLVGYEEHCGGGSFASSLLSSSHLPRATSSSPPAFPSLLGTTVESFSLLSSRANTVDLASAPIYQAPSPETAVPMAAITKPLSIIDTTSAQTHAMSAVDESDDSAGPFSRAPEKPMAEVAKKYNSGTGEDLFGEA